MSLQCQGPLVLWLLSHVIALWSPIHGNASDPSQHTYASLVSIDQALPVSSMMHQIGSALAHMRPEASQRVRPIATLVVSAAESGAW